jgi:hypothetical protein
MFYLDKEKLMEYTVGFKSVYYDVMYVFGDHCFEKHESLKWKFDNRGEPILTWKSRLLWWLYQRCMSISFDSGDSTYSILTNFEMTGE